MNLRAHALLIVVLVGACASTGPRPDRELLSFLATQETTRDEVIAELGPPSAAIDSDRILTYRIGGSEQRGLWIRGERENWYMTTFSLVLVFDEDGLLQRHSLVPVR